MSDVLRQAAARLSGRNSAVDLEAQESSTNESFLNPLTNYMGQWFGKEQEEDQSFFAGMFTLTRQQRMYGCVMSLALGLLCVFIACLMLPYILITSRKFAFMYTAGNLLLVLSTMFFMGPAQQMKTMFNSDRWIPSSVYLGSMVLTFIVALKFGNIVFVMTLIFIQLLAMGWYILTYIPFGMQIVSGVFAAARRLIQ